MLVPEPTVRADAREHHTALVRECGVWFGRLSVVRGVPVGEALARCGGTDVGTATVAHVRECGINAYPDTLPVVVADEQDGWTLLLEPDGAHGTAAEGLDRLSAGTVAASVEWGDIDQESSLALAVDGRVLAGFASDRGTAPEGPDPDAVAPFVTGLDFDVPGGEEAALLVFIERVSGVRITAQWIGERHRAAALVARDAFEPAFPRTWLDAAAPEVAASLPGLGATERYATAAEAAAGACRDAGVTGTAALRLLEADAAALDERERARRRDELADLALELSRRVLVMRWRRCQPPDETLPIGERLRLRMAQRDTEPVAERALQAQAYALGAAAGSLADDPSDAVALALRNARLSERERQPRPRQCPKSVRPDA
ncbi:hypothetical protein GCM10009801_50600 [Streptomyces albiaxialis]|uniref:Uncharacterized protein n=1 Tax=Streptomyces albiaxialis TaxID=329523 RepID=A0ABN2WAQ8_9ACTN